MTKASSKSMVAMNAFYPMVTITGFVQLLVPSTIHIIMKHFNLKAGEAAIVPLIYFFGMMLSAYTVLFISMSIGGILIPFGIGQVFQHAGPVIGMSSISLLFVMVTVLLLFIKKEIPISEHIHRNPMP